MQPACLIERSRKSIRESPELACGYGSAFFLPPVGIWRTEANAHLERERDRGSGNCRDIIARFGDSSKVPVRNAAAV